MEEQIKKLKEQYLKEKNKYIFDDTNIIEYEDFKYDDFIISINMISTNNKNMIFIYGDQDEHLLFKFLYKESTDSLTIDYNYLRNEIQNLSLEQIIDKIFKLFCN